jgi:hypothetical protein
MKKTILFLLLFPALLFAQWEANTEFAGYKQRVNQWLANNSYTVGSPSSLISPDTLHYNGADSLVLGPLEVWEFIDFEITFADTVAAGDSLDVDSLTVYQSNYNTFSSAQYVKNLTVYASDNTAYTATTTNGTYGGNFGILGTGFRPTRYFWVVIEFGSDSRVLSGNYVFATFHMFNPGGVPWYR